METCSPSSSAALTPFDVGTDLLDPALLSTYGIVLECKQDDRVVEDSIRQILQTVGEDPDREGLQDTPRRVARMYHELLAGYQINPRELLNNALFSVDRPQMVIVKDIEFYSLCEHHLLPFIGHASVGYIPRVRVIGLSKIPRIVDMFSRRLQIQERLTQQIADFISEVLNPIGVAVIVDAVHMCSLIRGVKKSDSNMVTSVLTGAFRDDDKTRLEFLSLLGRQTAWQRP
jgi:GTP cyclohydrolase IA